MTLLEWICVVLVVVLAVAVAVLWTYEGELDDDFRHDPPDDVPVDE